MEERISNNIHVDDIPEGSPVTVVEVKDKLYPISTKPYLNIYFFGTQRIFWNDGGHTRLRKMDVSYGGKYDELPQVLPDNFFDKKEK